MTSPILDSTSKSIAKLQTLAPEQQQEVLDFVEFLAQKYAQPQQPPQKRVLGLNQDKIWISDDFNDPLSWWAEKFISMSLRVERSVTFAQRLVEKQSQWF
ncbi:MAG: DUF2281 domain-containing protein [Nostoc sp.]|uniref:type II toxin-antitoxin system VapB family antitoxin n=1 Tax=Nostoc sp. TaxID=1180 RepID=UPI002FFA5D8F